MNESTNPQELDQPKTSAFSRIIGVITSPRPTMDDIARFPTWFLPLAISTIAGAVATWFLQDLIVEAQMTQLANNPDLNEQQIEAQRGVMEAMGPFFAIFTIVFGPLFTVIIAAVLLFTGNFILGGESRFKVLFSTTCWAGIIYSVITIFSTPLMLASGKMEPVASLVFLAPTNDPTSFLYALLVRIDLLSLWWVIVVGLGIGAAYKFSNQKGITVAVVWWLIMILVGAVFTAGF